MTLWVAPLITSHYPPKFGGHRPCGREDILVLVCHMTSSDFVVRDSCSIMVEFPSIVATLQSW